VQRYGFEEAAREVQDLYLSGKKEEAAAALPAELIDTICLVGPREAVRDRLQAYDEAGVGTLVLTPVAFDPEARRRMIHEVAELV
jgi:alkanesulfonate monooxygenase SsuD/methylene tetrahydromethanopterin reductase-like flavin-dependent oxidoreductase (luciferase family)